MTVDCNELMPENEIEQTRAAWQKKKLNRRIIFVVSVIVVTLLLF
jgi:hypothetical protein